MLNKKLEKRLREIERKIEWIEDIRIDGIRDRVYRQINAIYEYLGIEEKSKPLFLEKKEKK